jgi:hypothetical protein
MKTFIKNLFKIEKKPKKGLMALEWVMVSYLVLTLLYTFFLQTKLVNPEAMIWGRLRILVTTLLLWGVYRLLPCRLTRFIRVAVQFGLLAWWYQDTYELNRILPNLDHIFAQWDQDWFGCQPALLFSQQWSSPVYSEVLDIAYVAYFPMIFTVLFYYFLYQYQEFERASFIVLAGFLAILPEWICQKWTQRIINIHPSLLPKHGGKGMYGIHVQEAVLAAGDTEAGCTVHYVSAEVDGGNIIAQATVEVLPNDTPETLSQRVQAEEKKLLPRIIGELSINL